MYGNIIKAAIAESKDVFVPLSIEKAQKMLSDAGFKEIWDFLPTQEGSFPHRRIGENIT